MVFFLGALATLLTLRRLWRKRADASREELALLAIGPAPMRGAPGERLGRLAGR